MLNTQPTTKLIINPMQAEYIISIGIFSSPIILKLNCNWLVAGQKYIHLESSANDEKINKYNIEIILRIKGVVIFSVKMHTEAIKAIKQIDPIIEITYALKTHKINSLDKSSCFTNNSEINDNVKDSK